MAEADIHFEFYRHLQDAIEEKPDRGDITFGKVRPEYSQNINGRADIVVFDTQGEPIFVLEAKRPDNGGSRNIDPYSSAVIRQAFGYAGDLGAPFFCTYNGERLVIFDAFTEGVPLLERSTKSYAISDVEEFADTLLDEIARLSVGKTKWDAIDDAFIARINSLHEYVAPEIEDSLAEKLDVDDDFRTKFIEWTAAQGRNYDDASQSDRVEIREDVADQATYLLINKIIFHKILENTATYVDDIEPLAVSPYRVQEDLEEYFQHIVDNVDFQAIYNHDEIYSEIPLDRVDNKIREFIIELDNRNLSQFDSDIVGRIYEGVIPPDRRREMGEYYTPPAICDLITRLTVTDANDTVLDPACGSGGFLVSAYHRIRELLPEPTGSHERILTQITGSEINRFPAHLTTINLAIQDLSSYTEEVDIEITDFFDIKKYQRFRRERAGPEGGKTEEGMTKQTGGFDAIVGNPPYIRQENIDDKDHVRDHLSSREIDAEYISRRSDIYTYFISHATQFLSDGGDLGFIISDRWLDSKYGEDLQQFILENYEIRAIIKFDRQVFDDALVDSSVLVLRKQTDKEARESNVAKFIRLKKQIGIEKIVSLVEDDREPDQLVPENQYRLVTRLQAALHHENKWSVFFFAPPIYFDFESKPEVVPLSDISEVNRGVMTGANDFFTGHTKEMVELGLEPYLTPLLKATGQVNNILVSEEEAYEWSILDVHPLVQEALNEDAEFGRSDEERVKEAVARLCPYCWQSFSGGNGVMIHLGQVGGRKNHPEDAAEHHEPEDFPPVELDMDDNVIGVVNEDEHPLQGTLTTKDVYRYIAMLLAEGRFEEVNEARQHLLPLVEDSNHS